MMNKYLGAFIISVVFFSVYSFRLTTSFNWDTDWGRDLYDMVKIAQGDISLIGPPLTGGVFSGPYYYYLLIPILILSRGHEEAILFFNSGLFALSLGVFYLTWTLKKNDYSTVIGVASIGLTPFWLSAARHPGNAYTYLPLLLIAITLVFFKRNWDHVSLLLLGILFGIIINFHPANILILPVIILIVSRKIINKRQVWLVILGVLITLLPLMLFEIKHQGLLSKTIINGKFFELLRFNPGGDVSNISGWRFENHYLLPIILFLVLFLVTSNFFNSKLLKTLFLVLLISVFPTDSYNYSARGKLDVEAAANFVIENKLVKNDDAFNVIAILEENHYVPAGNDYRYFLIQRHLKPLDNTNYKDAKVLIIFSEINNLQAERLNMWEIEEFNLENAIIASKNMSRSVEILTYVKQ